MKPMYQQIAVAVDNSEHSQHAEDLAVSLAREFRAELTGYHIYSGKFHRMRFQALEEYLPPRYQKEEVLDYQRKIHSVLIERGLEIISSEYMKRLRDTCSQENIAFREVITDGKRSDLLCEATAGHDLMVIGAQGIGRVAGISGLGSTSERVVRSSSCDVLVIRNSCSPVRILVGIDGSEASLAALDRAQEIGGIFRSDLTLLASHNPLLHRSVFDLLSGVLSREAGSVFRFQEQEQLHNRIIDRSLEDLYQRHLENGAARAEKGGLLVQTKIASGTPWHALCAEAAAGHYDLVVVGRFGMHRGRFDQIGSNASRVAERALSNVLIAGGTGYGRRAEEMSGPATVPPEEPPALLWTPEARKRLEKVPSFARPMAVLGIERFARENGLVTITSDVMDEARKKIGL
jgi:nucleotide-binding universal stress UspA family protein